MLPTIDQLSTTSLTYLPAFRKRSYWLYWSMLIMIICVLICLPFIHTTIAITSQGIIRPTSERTEVKPVIGGMVDTLYYAEGSNIKKGAILMRIKDRLTKSKRRYNNFQIDQHQHFIHDLRLLTTNEPDVNLLPRLLSSVYKEQLSHYLYQKNDHDINIKKASKELSTNTTLLNSRVITQKEFFDTQVQADRAESSYQAFKVEQQSSWQQDLSKYSLEISQYEEERNQVNTDASYYEIKAPISGTLQGINTLYTGGIIQPGQVLCTISPNDDLIAECYIQPKDIGMIKNGQKANFQIDAFNYNFFGMVTGRVKTIDNDFTTLNNTPVFKVHCQFDKTNMHLKNGFTGQLKKGLSFQVRFLIGERSFWQLLWDDLDDWLDPMAPQKI